MSKCSSCEGSGKCMHCYGYGEKPRGSDYHNASTECDYCDGSGKCSECTTPEES